MINWKELGKQASWPNGGSIPTCSQRDSEKPKKICQDTRFVGLASNQTLDDQRATVTAISVCPLMCP